MIRSSNPQSKKPKNKNFTRHHCPKKPKTKQKIPTQEKIPKNSMLVFYLTYNNLDGDGFIQIWEFFDRIFSFVDHCQHTFLWAVTNIAFLIVILNH